MKQTTTKKVVADLKRQLSSVSKIRKPNVTKIILELKDKNNSDVYSYILYRSGEGYYSMCSRIKQDGTEEHINKSLVDLTTEILDKLDNHNYQLVDYNGIFDIDTKETFDEKSLRHFVKKAKKEIIDKMITNDTQKKIK